MPSTRRGFTLVELLVVILIIGLIAAIAIPKWGNARERAFMAAMRSDLRSVALHQESYLYNNRVYTPDLNALGAVGLQTSDGVTITVNEATTTGWSGTAMHTGTPVRCYLFVGNAAPVGSATTEGQVDCS